MQTVDHHRSGIALGTLIEDVASGERSGSGIAPVPTGFHPLDDALDGGLQARELVLLGGCPAVGKTLTALQWARTMAGAGRHVLFACFEHDESALLGRLLSQELASASSTLDITAQVRCRRAVRELSMGLRTVDELGDAAQHVQPALQSLYDHAPTLRLMRASGQHSSPAELAALAAEHLEPGGVLVVDYLQKLPVESARSLEERVHLATEQLKDLATSLNITVLALSSADAGGIGIDRLRLRHLRGSAALAHEADVAMILNEKATATSPRHLDFDITQIEKAKGKVVLSIEKNRRGESDLHFEFDKDFGSYRLHPKGAFITEALVGDH